MSLYARSDLMSVSIPQTSGGCGAVHSRSVTRGAPAKEWKLDCNPCESYLRGDGKPKLIKNIPGDKEQNIPGRMEHVADSDPHWSSTPEGIPLTPDEQHINKIRAERGKEQLEMLRTYVALQGVPGLDLKDFSEAQWMLDRTLDPLKRPPVPKSDETVACVSGHKNSLATKFCGECGIPMPTDLAAATAAIPLGTLHIATLKKMARSRDLSDKGTKVQLIERLTT